MNLDFNEINNDVLRRIMMDSASAEDYDYYKRNIMTKEEKQIGKPFYEMDNDEFNLYNVTRLNNTRGNLGYYDCPKCLNKGYIYKLNKGEKTTESCDCLGIRKSLKMLEMSGLGNLLELCTFDKFECPEQWQVEAKEKAQAFVKSNDKWFVMSGQSGSGKTHLCVAVAKELMLQGKDMVYMSWIDASNQLKQAICSEDYNSLIAKYKNATVLYIDDLFKSESNAIPTNADIKLANEILNYRYNIARISNDRIITIISTEKTLRQLNEYDSAIAGRIMEMSMNNFITLKGDEKNYRFNKFMENFKE